MAALLTLLLVVCVAGSLAEVVPEPWYGDFLGALPDPQNVGVKGDVYVVNETCLQVIGFSYGGQAPDLYFWADPTEQLSSAGVKIPTFEFGSRPLNKYENARVVLILPHFHKLSDFRSVGLWCKAFSKEFGRAQLSAAAAAPPRAQFLSGTLAATEAGERYKVGSGPVVVLDRRTVRLLGFRFDGAAAPDGFFFVGSGDRPRHDAGVKVPVRGKDSPGAVYSIKDKYTGGKDVIIELPEDHDIYNIDWISLYCYRFQVDFGHIMVADLSDRIPPFVPMQKRWDPCEGLQDETLTECRLQYEKPQKPAWPPMELLGNEQRTNFTFQLGPPGGRRGYEAWAESRPNEYVWYVNGLMSPKLVLQRGVTYTFIVEGGADESTANFYNPLYFSNEPFGGFMKLSEHDRQQVQAYAGLDASMAPIQRRGISTVGRQCVWEVYPADIDADMFDDFLSFREKLHLRCGDGAAGVFTWTPDHNTPDIVYYQSYVNYNMGGQMMVTDELPSDLPDMTEPPYRYEELLEENRSNGNRNNVYDNAAPSLQRSLAHASLCILLLVTLRSVFN